MDGWDGHASETRKLAHISTSEVKRGKEMRRGGNGGGEY